MGHESHTISRFDKLRFKTEKEPIKSENKALVRQTIYIYFFLARENMISYSGIFFLTYIVITFKYERETESKNQWSLIRRY